MKLLAVLAIASVCAVGSAQLFYGGNPDLVDGLVSGRNLVSAGEAQTFDGFTLGSNATAGSIFGNFFMGSGYTTASITQAYYEIRQGITAGNNGGTLVSSGLVAASAVDTGTSGFGLAIYKITSAPVNVGLTAGSYYVTLAPVGNGSASIYLATTGGVGGVGGPLANGDSWFHSVSVYAGSPGWYSTTDPVNALGAGTWDFSIGVNPVPEPASMAVLGIGALAMLRRRKKA